MGTYALSAGYYDAYYKRAQQASLFQPCHRHRNAWPPGRPPTAEQQHPTLPTKTVISRRRPSGRLSAPPPPLPVQVRTLIQREMGAALQSYDALLCPAAPTPAYKLGEKTSDPLAMYKGEEV